MQSLEIERRSWLGGRASTAGKSGLWRTTNDGADWVNLDTVLDSNYDFLDGISQIQSIAMHSDTIVATSNGLPDMATSYDDGVTWIPDSNFHPPSPPVVLFVGDTLFRESLVGNGEGNYQGFGLSLDYGMHWQWLSGAPTPDAPNNTLRFTAFTAFGDSLFVGTDDGRIYAAMNGIVGTNSSGGDSIKLSLVSRNPSTIGITGFAKIGQFMFASGNRGGHPKDSGFIFRSNDAGRSWELVNNSLPGAAVMIAAGTNLFVGTDTGVYFSRDSGATWVPVNAGLPFSVSGVPFNPTLCNFAVKDGYIFSTVTYGSPSYGADVYRQPLSDFGMSDVNSSNVPAEVSLHPTYPNPCDASALVTLCASTAGDSLTNSV